MPRPRASKLSTPYLRRVWLDEARIENRAAFPFSLPILREGFDLSLDRAVTVIIGERCQEVSTILAAIATFAGYDEAGRHRIENVPDDEFNRERLARALRATWQPKITQGWFLRAESLFSLPRRLDETPLTSDATLPEYPGRSHGEELIRFVDERRHRLGVFIFDRPEVVLSPARQLEFLKLLRRVEMSCQVIMATHSPLLMAFPGARLLRLSERGIRGVTLEATDDFRLLLGFCTNPRQFVRTALEE
jgi:predicted ATPase